MSHYHGQTALDQCQAEVLRLRRAVRDAENRAEIWQTWVAILAPAVLFLLGVIGLMGRW